MSTLRPSGTYHDGVSFRDDDDDGGAWSGDGRHKETGSVGLCPDGDCNHCLHVTWQ